MPTLSGMSTQTTHPPRDPYAHIGELDESVVAGLADRIEIRASDERQRRLWRDFLARPAFADGAQVLEVGCGTGVITAMIAELPGVARAVGVDPSPYFVARARDRAPDVRFEVADGRALPFEDGAFDGVVFATTLCHIPEPERALAEARRVLRPGGTLAVYDGDYATATVAVARHDPLQCCVDAAIGALVHDPWLVRRLVSLVREGGFEPGPLTSHGHVETDGPSYMLGMVGFGADTLAGAGVIDADAAEALKTEARRRADTGRFFGHIAYASLLARR
jgi:ubiquinone/menaquinone biosynthesis C-methylase UbiE